tara:strand:+ start:415 stop:840 length:426 start_codon:yes stop_codon:yes gene_type:complete
MATSPGTAPSKDSIYYQVGRVISGVMSESEDVTTEHMRLQVSSNNVGWEASLQKTQTDTETLAKARQSEYSDFDEIRWGDLEEQIDDILQNIIAGVTAEVITLIVDDKTLDEQFQADNKARLGAWAEIAAAIGPDGDINIQ